MGSKKALAILAISFNTTTLAVVFLMFYFWSTDLAMCSDMVFLSGVIAVIMNLIFASMIQVNKKP